MFCRSILRAVTFAVVTWTLACSDSASATVVWSNGQVITYPQAAWGDPLTSAASILQTNYSTVYASTSGLFEIGIPGPSGFSLLFTGASTLLAYLPQGGAPAALDSDLVDPTTSHSEQLGGEVAALKLNIDFSDAGFTLGTSGIPFGNLILANFSTLPLLDGLTVRQFLDDMNLWLGGGTSIYSISDLTPIAQSLNATFDSGLFVNPFADDHLVAPTAPVSQVPEPSSLLLFVSGLLTLGAMRRFGPRRRSFMPVM